MAPTGRCVSGDGVISLVSTGKAYNINVKSGKAHPSIQIYNKQ